MGRASVRHGVWKPLVEDFAEAFRVYIEKPSELKKVAPEKFEALKTLVG